MVMSSDWGGSATRGIIIAVVGMALAAARRYLPQNRPLKDDEAIDASGKQPYVALCMVGVGIAIAAGSFFAMKGLNHWMAARDGTAVLRLLPESFEWMFFPLFGGLSLAWGTTLWIWSLFAGKEVPRAYALWSDKKSGMQSTRIMKWMGWLLGVPVGIANVLAVPVHANLSHDGISVGHYAQWSPERHSYADVEEYLIVQGYREKDGSFASQPRVILRFTDGREWNSFSTREDNPVNPELVAYLTKKLGKEPEVLETE
ncbi:MAG: hypothetical protein V4555_11170 [Acidobacteriota bacterium]